MEIKLMTTFDLLTIKLIKMAFKILNRKKVEFIVNTDDIATVYVDEKDSSTTIYLRHGREIKVDESFDKLKSMLEAKGA